MQRLLTLLSLIALITLVVPPASVRAQGTETPQLLVDRLLNDSPRNKFPDIASFGQTMMIAGNVSKDGTKNTTNALAWVFSEQATTIGAGTDIGPSLGKPDYSSAAVTSAPDGSFYAAWGSINERKIYLRRRDATGTWGALRTVTSGGFPVYSRVAVSTSGKLFVVWEDVEVPVLLKVSNDQGATFSATIKTAELPYSKPATIATGPNDAVAISFQTKDLRAAVATWNGSSLNAAEILTAAKSAADVSVSYGPDGKLYAAWRGIATSGPASGVQYAERQGANSWQVTQLVDGDVKGRVSVVVDDNSSVHLGWSALISGNIRFYYAFRVFGETQFTKAVATNTTPIYNSRLIVTSSGAFAHAALENFVGSVTYITYARFSGSSGGKPKATPQINGGSTTLIKRTSTVDLTFLAVSGDPTQIRWSWGSAPSDTQNDSNGWQPFASQMKVTIPDAVLNAATCSPLQLFTQVRDADQTLGNAQSATVTIDAGVTAAVVLSNPHMLNKSPQFSDLDAILGDYSQDGGASDGHPSYTRDLGMYVGVQGLSECSGIEDLATGRSTTTVAPALLVSKDSFSNVLPPVGTFQAGSNSVLLRVSDKVGNTRDYTQTLIFDVSPPLLDTASSSFSATSNADATILAALNFDTIKVTDNVYPAPGFWGVWVANSRTSVDTPASNSGLIWYPIVAPGSDTSFTINNWSLAAGLKVADLSTGDYYIYVRFLDGAGNPTAEVLSYKLTLTTLTFPKTNLPLVRR